MIRAKRAAALVASLALSGCAFDFTGIEDRSTARLNVALLVDPAADRLTLEAALTPGRDAERRYRRVTSGLALLGQFVEPYAREGDALMYESQWSLSEVRDAGTPLTLTTPVIAGIEAGARTMDIPVPVRVGEGTLRAAEGDSLLLHLLTDTTFSGSDYTMWELHFLDGSGGVVFRAQSTGVPPERILAPAWLVPEPKSIRSIRIRIRQIHAADLSPDLYLLQVVLQTDLHWDVAWSD